MYLNSIHQQQQQEQQLQQQQNAQIIVAQQHQQQSQLIQQHHQQSHYVIKLVPSPLEYIHNTTDSNSNQGQNTQFSTNIVNNHQQHTTFCMPLISANDAKQIDYILNDLNALSNNHVIERHDSNINAIQSKCLF